MAKKGEKLSKEMLDKMRKGKEEVERKLFDFMGYEIKMDPYNFIVLREGEYHFFGNWIDVFKYINKETNDLKIETSANNLVRDLENRDNAFLAGLQSSIKGILEAINNPPDGLY